MRGGRRAQYDATVTAQNTAAVMAMMILGCSSAAKPESPDATGGPPVADAAGPARDAAAPRTPDAAMATCTPVSPAPDVDPWSVRAPGAGFGGIVQQNGTYHDVFLQRPAVGGLPAN